MGQRRPEHPTDLRPVRLAAIVLALRHLARVSMEVRAGDVVMLADLGTAQAGEERLGLIGAGAVEAVGFPVVDAAHIEVGM